MNVVAHPRCQVLFAADQLELLRRFKLVSANSTIYSTHSAAINEKRQMVTGCTQHPLQRV